MVMTQESHIPVSPELIGPDQQFEQTDAPEASFFCEAPVSPALPPVPRPEVHGVRREPEPPYETALNGLRRSVTLMLGLPTGLSAQRFCTEALGAASWRDHEILRRLIEECDPEGRWLGLRRTP